MPREQADALANAQKKAIDEMVTARELAGSGFRRRFTAFFLPRSGGAF